MKLQGSKGWRVRDRGRRPCVWFVGDVQHVDFRDAVELLRRDVQLHSWPAFGCAATIEAGSALSPELIIIAQTRPGEISLDIVEQLRRAHPLAGVVSLLGSWCEGHSRTGRPLPGAEHLYWHEFSAWWLRQRTLLAAGRCPDWARPGSRDRIERSSSITAAPEIGRSSGLIVISTPRWETADALGDVFHSVGFSTLWQQFGKAWSQVRGVIAGVWEGGQLDEVEAKNLSLFAGRLAHESGPVIAILDFPRRSTLDRATSLGAATVIGKPWNNDELIAVVQRAIAGELHFAGNASKSHQRICS